MASIFQNRDTNDTVFEELDTNDTQQITHENQLKANICDTLLEHLAPPHAQASDGPQPPRGGILLVAVCLSATIARQYADFLANLTLLQLLVAKDGESTFQISLRNMKPVLQLAGTTVSERKLKLQNILRKVLQILVSTIENGSLGMAALLLCAQKGCLRCHAKTKLTKAENVIATCNQSEPISCTSKSDE